MNPQRWAAAPAVSDPVQGHHIPLRAMALPMTFENIAITESYRTARASKRAELRDGAGPARSLTVAVLNPCVFGINSGIRPPPFLQASGGPKFPKSALNGADTIER